MGGQQWPVGCSTFCDRRTQSGPAVGLPTTRIISERMQNRVSVKKNPYSMQQGEVKKPPRCAPCACAPNCTTPTVKRKGPALTQLKMPACGVSIERQSGVALPPKDGIDDGRAHSRDQSDRDPLQASRKG